MDSNQKDTKIWSADEARQATKPVDLEFVMRMIGTAVRNNDNKVIIHPTKLIDDNLKNELMSKGFKISYFTDGIIQLKGLLIEW